jgi:hypothetical protein
MQTSCRASSCTASTRRVYHVGHRIFPRSGGSIDNFPKQNLDNGRAKNNSTNRRYKQIVRCLKRLEGELVEQGKIAREYPGYLVECMLYNVLDIYFTSEPTSTRRSGTASPSSGEVFATRRHTTRGSK